MGRALRCWVSLPLVLLMAGCGNQNSGNDVASGKLVTRSVMPASPGAPSYDLALGESVFTDRCLRCHGEGVYDAPRLGNAGDWEARVRQDLATLIEHAVKGHGRMPPKGGFSELSDQEVSAAVAYVVDRSNKIILALKRRQQDAECHPDRAPENCDSVDAKDFMTLQMLWLLGAPREQQ